jgi:hypothetical protein
LYGVWLGFVAAPSADSRQLLCFIEVPFRCFASSRNVIGA